MAVSLIGGGNQRKPTSLLCDILLMDIYYQEHVTSSVYIDDFCQMYLPLFLEVVAMATHFLCCHPIQ
jgi:hypothetical protein